jgi:hypothetical protein
MVIPTDLDSPLLGSDKKENFAQALPSVLFGIKLSPLTLPLSPANGGEGGGEGEG